MMSIRFDNVTVERVGAGVVLRELSWSVDPGETWAIVGPNGSGKTTVAETILGRHRITHGTVRLPPLGSAHLIAFRADSRLFSHDRHYYQQRYNFVEPEDDLTLAEFLAADNTATWEVRRAVANRLGIGRLLSLSLIKLSNGQLRRARIAKALLAQPGTLILDDPFMGLDVAGRRDLNDVLNELVRDGTRLIVVARPNEIPECVTHVLSLNPSRPPKTIPRSQFSDETAIRPVPTAEHPPVVTGEPIVELHDVHVRYRDQAVLKGVTWSVRTGERWALLGPNGSGKSTLLSLLYGDHPQAYANDVRIFGRRRGTGETIWDVKRHVGFFSSELHTYFTEPLTAAEAIATGFHDVLARRRITPEQAQRVRTILDDFGLSTLADRVFGRLSTGEQRLLLMARALVKRPTLVILDEPFQGLDADRIKMARQWLDHHLGSDQTLIFVTHHPEELPDCVNRVVRLEQGVANHRTPFSN